MDSLHIKGLTVATRIGVHEWEQRIAQKLLLDITIPIDCSTCHDDITNTIDYESLCRRVSDYVEANAFKLIETVAHNVAQFIKDEFAIKQLTVQVSKPHAISNADNIVVSVTR